MELYEKAESKLNLSLDVLGKRPDGYHDLRMVMQSISFGDDVYIEDGPTGEISCSVTMDFLPTDGKNLAAAAAAAFLKKIGREKIGLKIHLDKKTPVCAGMGGGSSDAAAVLRALNRAFDSPLSSHELAAVGEGVGSDVPFCLFGGTALAEGKGERLMELPAMPMCRIVIAKPAVSIRTPELFPKIDSRKSHLHPNTDEIISALTAGNLKDLGRRMYNVFEDVLPRNAMDVSLYKSILFEEGALGAVMTGTGSAVFGVFDDDIKAKKAFERLSAYTDDCFNAVPTGKSLDY